MTGRAVLLTGGWLEEEESERTADQSPFHRESEIYKGKVAKEGEREREREKMCEREEERKR